MSRNIALAVAAVLAFFGSSCCGATPKAGNVSLESALEQVGVGLNKLYDVRQGHPQAGLFPSEVTVEFNISSKESSSDKLYVEMGAQAGDAVKLAKLGAEHGQAYEASRGNTITIKFVNVAFAPIDKSLLNQDPAKIKQILDILHATEIKPTLRNDKGDAPRPGDAPKP